MIREKREKIFFTTRDLAEMGIRSEGALRTDRWMRRGIPFVKLGKRSVRYRREDVEAFIEKRLVGISES